MYDKYVNSFMKRRNYTWF